MTGRPVPVRITEHDIAIGRAAGTPEERRVELAGRHAGHTVVARTSTEEGGC